MMMFLKKAKSGTATARFIGFSIWKVLFFVKLRLGRRSEVGLEFSYFGVTAHVLDCKYPAIAAADLAFALAFPVGFASLLGGISLAIPGAGT